MFKKTEIFKYKKDKIFKEEDILAKELRFEIFVNDRSIYTTMRTPGRDEDLVIGYLFTRGIIEDVDQIKSIKLEEEKGYVYLKKDFDENNIKNDLKKTNSFNLIKPTDLFSLRDKFVERMVLFERTGCAHASSLYNKDLENLAFAEDVGRHNALDKVIGNVLKNRKKEKLFLCVMSSRLSFEILQKAAKAGVEILAGISAPTSYAVEMARSLNITLIGFLRENRMNIYSYPERIKV